MATSTFYTKDKVDELLSQSGGIPSITITMGQFSDETHFTLTEDQAHAIIENDLISITIQHHLLPGYGNLMKYDGVYSKSDDNPYPSLAFEDIFALTRIVAKEDISDGFFIGRIKITATKLGDEYIYTTFSGEFDFGESGAKLLTKVTYAQITSLKEQGKLVPGAKYRITDYECKVGDDDSYRAVSHPFDIIVTADSETSLNENCSAILHEGDTYFANSDLSSWQLKYSIDNGKRLWGKLGGVVVSAPGFGDLGNKTSLTETISGTEYDVWSVVQAVQSTLGTDKLYVMHGITPATTDDVYLQVAPGYLVDVSTAFGTTLPLTVTQKEGGKGVVYYMKDNLGNEAYYDFKGVQFIRYRCTGKASGYENYPDFSEEYIGYKDSTEGSGIYPDAYTYDEDDARWYYTFGEMYAGETETADTSVHPSTRMAFNNVIKESVSTGSTLPDIVFLHEGASGNEFGPVCEHDTFGGNCWRNTFGDGCSYNTFSDSCYSNTFGDGCHSNTFGSQCDDNTFGTNFTNNTFVSVCYDNAFESSCYYNTFVNACYFNTFRSYFSSNTFGGSCDNNTFGSSCHNNDFSNSITYSDIGSDIAFVTLTGYITNVVVSTGLHSKTVNIPSHTGTYTIVAAGSTTVEV